MKLTKREEELNKAREQGAEDFERGMNKKGERYEDPGLKAAYQAGWGQAQRDQNLWNVFGRY